jgi:hypothetical protein
VKSKENVSEEEEFKINVGLLVSLLVYKGRDAVGLEKVIVLVFMDNEQ